MPKRNTSPNAPAAKKLKYQTKFNSAWISEFKWCASSSKGSEFAHCNSCRSDFRVCYGGRNDLKKHFESISHQKNYNCVSSIPTVTSMFGSNSLVNKVACAETLFVNYVAEHNYPFLMADTHKNVDKKSPVFRPKLQLKNFKSPVLS